jgi:membrane-associated phospholipid phosphatase
VRTRYFVCFVLVWIVLGNIVALAFLSAGPAFYHHFADDGGRFTEQLAFLAHGIDGSHSAARFQAYLWSSYESGQGGLGTGISAFPSVHVGLATMNALFVREYSRSLGVLAFIYVGFIVLSSVYLGWHYAIDGYASIILVIALHMAVKRYLPRFRSLTSVTAS